MNPLGHAQLAQYTHREYEAKYGNRYRGNESGRARHSQPSHQKLVLALSGASVVAALMILAYLL